MALFRHGITYGLILSVGISVLFIAGALWNREIMMRGYPPDIKAAYGPLRPETMRQRVLFMIPVLIFIAWVLNVAITRLPAITGQPPSFGPVFTTAFLVLMTFNLVDLLVLDWLIFVKLQPKFVILPGTEGMAGYQDYAFHFHGFLKGTIGMILVSLLIATGVSLWT